MFTDEELYFLVSKGADTYEKTLTLLNYSMNVDDSSAFWKDISVSIYEKIKMFGSKGLSEALEHYMLNQQTR